MRCPDTCRNLVRTMYIAYNVYNRLIAPITSTAASSSAHKRLTKSRSSSAADMERMYFFQFILCVLYLKLFPCCPGLSWKEGERLRSFRPALCICQHIGLPYVLLNKQMLHEQCYHYSSFFAMRRSLPDTGHPSFHDQQRCCIPSMR